MKKTPAFFVVEAAALPEVFLKVAEAKRLMDTGEVDTVNAATQAVGISRSAFYKYKDAIRPFNDMLHGRIVTFQMMLKDERGVLSAVLGVLVSMALIRCGKTRGGMLYAVRLPILVPHAVVAVFVIQIFSQTGLIARLGYALGLLEDSAQFPQLLYTPGYWGAILAYLWKEIPFVAYFVLAFMSSISDTLGQAAENLGADPLRSFFEVTLPLSVPVIAKAFLIIFIFAFGGYELPLLLGSTLPKALSVQTHLVYMSPDLLQRPLAMAMNGVVLLLSGGMALGYGILVTKLNRKIGGAR